MTFGKQRPEARPWSPPAAPEPEPAPEPTPSEYDTSGLRRASSTHRHPGTEFTTFPYGEDTTTFIQVRPDKVVLQATKVETKLQAVAQVREHGGLLLAVWPGRWSSDCFVVDDLEDARLSLEWEQQDRLDRERAKQERARGR